MINPIKEAIKFLDDPCFESLNISYIQSKDENYLSIAKEGNDVSITYGQLSSLFRGLTLVKEHKDEKRYQLKFNRNFSTNCWMIDVSRNATFKLSQYQLMILVL